jgi:hypothetical protein
MPPSDRGSLKTAFAGFKRPAPDEEAEQKLLGRTLTEPAPPSTLGGAVAGAAPALNPAQGMPDPANSYQIPTSAVVGNLTPRPLMQREATRQLSFRCGVSLSAELRRKAAFNQLEQQQIIIEGLKRVLAELPSPPPGWDESSI